MPRCVAAGCEVAAAAASGPLAGSRSNRRTVGRSSPRLRRSCWLRRSSREAGVDAPGCCRCCCESAGHGPPGCRLSGLAGSGVVFTTRLLGSAIVLTAFGFFLAGTHLFFDHPHAPVRSPQAAPEPAQRDRPALRRHSARSAEAVDLRPAHWRSLPAGVSRYRSTPPAVDKPAKASECYLVPEIGTLYLHDQSVRGALRSGARVHYLVCCARRSFSRSSMLMVASPGNAEAAAGGRRRRCANGGRGRRGGPNGGGRSGGRHGRGGRGRCDRHGRGDIRAVQQVMPDVDFHRLAVRLELEGRSPRSAPSSRKA